MRTSIATVCLSGTLTDKLHAAADAGFDGVEIFEPDLVASQASPEEVVALAARLGLTLDLYQPFRDAEGVTEAEFEGVLRRARAKFALMQRLGIGTMLVCSNVATATIDDDDVSASQLRRLGEEAAAHGVRIAYEALAWGRFVDDYRRAWRIVELADHEAVGTCLDSFHILSRGHDPAAIEEIPGSKIFFLQLADAPLLTMDVLSWSRHHRLFPGEGGFDLGAFLGHVLRAGYDGPLSLEVFNDIFRQTDVARTALQARRSLIWLEDLVASASAWDSAPDPPTRCPLSPNRQPSTSSRSAPTTPARSTSCSASSVSRSGADIGARTHACGPRVRRAWSATSSTPATGPRRWRRSASRSRTRQRRPRGRGHSGRRRSIAVPSPTSRSSRPSAHPTAPRSSSAHRPRPPTPPGSRSSRAARTAPPPS